METLETSKRCSGCDITKPLTAFQKNRCHRDGLENWCRDCKSSGASKRREERKKAGLCHCGRAPMKDRKICRVCRKRGGKWQKENRLYVTQIEKARRYAEKERVLDHYGHRCLCPGGCEITESDFLTVDHIENNGGAHRRELGIGGGAAFYHWLIVNKFPVGYRTLCYNCHFTRSYFSMCPHEPGFRDLRDIHGTPKRPKRTDKETI